MNADRRPLWQPFSEPLVDQPAVEERERLLPVERLPFREPSAPEPGVPRQGAAGGRTPLGSGGLTFAAADGALPGGS
ncbi:hypothetical protein ACIRS1_19630 [Kitasatospora sp. NPDC101176]|uniref:hypothetical protein n=1 Tax=Kitasatospora sp. NPDC101176 TaxID=3364099 RepID=UPI0037F1EC0E